MTGAHPARNAPRDLAPSAPVRVALCVGLRTGALALGMGLPLAACELDDRQRSEAEARVRAAQQGLEEASRKARKELDGLSAQASKELERANEKVERARAQLDDATTFTPIEGAEKAVRCEGRVCVIDQEFARLVGEKPELIVRELRVAPAFRGGRVVGLRVLHVPEGSVPALVGLRPGDVVTQVDGHRITAMQDLAALAAQDRRGKRDVIVELDRSGEAVFLTLRTG